MTTPVAEWFLVACDTGSGSVVWLQWHADTYGSRKVLS